MCERMLRLLRYSAILGSATESEDYVTVFVGASLVTTGEQRPIFCGRHK